VALRRGAARSTHDDPRTRGRLAVATGAAVGTIYGVQGLSAALPAMQDALHISDGQLGLFTAAYMLPATIFAIPFGYLADIVGRRRVFVVTALLWSLAGMAQGWASDFTMLIVLRVVQGIGFAALMPLSITLIGDALRGERQLRAQASRQVSMTVGEFVLPLAGAGLVAISWHAPLFAQGLLLLLALAGWIFLDDERHGRAVAAEPSRGYAHELTAVVREPGMGAVLGAGFLRFWCKFGIVTYAPTLLVNDRGATALQAALIVSISSLAAAATGTQVVRAMRHVAASRLLMLAVALVGCSLFALAIVPTWQLALLLALFYGIGDGVLMVLQNAIVTEAAPASVRGGLVGVSAMTRNAGKLVAPLAVGAIALVAPMAWALAAVGASALVFVPIARRVSPLDGALRPHATPLPSD
jgi:ACDE family multidrug resistance protein